MTLTMIRSMREGAEMSQAEAARSIGVTPPTLAAYEGGRFTPSASKTNHIARAIALGKAAKGERDPRFLLTYWLFTQRFLADGAGRLVAFMDPVVAHEHATRLIRAGFPHVAVVPVWRSKRRSLLRAIGAPREVTGDELDDPLGALLEHARTLADEYDRLRAEPRTVG